MTAVTPTTAYPTPFRIFRLCLLLLLPILQVPFLWHSVAAFRPALFYSALPALSPRFFGS